MFSAIKRLIGSGSKVVDQGGVLAAWAKAEGHAFKHVSGRSPGYVVETKRGWRAEWGASQRKLYIPGQELRFRSESTMPHDVQLVMLTRALAHTLETDVFSRYTNDMQTQIDTSLPDEMRWLAMHPQVDTPQSPKLGKRFVILSNAVEVSQLWLDETLIHAFEQAAEAWWTDTLMLVLTVNRGMLTMRMAGDLIDPMLLEQVADLFDLASRRLREAALQTAA
ncbi:MAG: hypothetical protein KGI91_12025 [Burkholderiales bacterium]|nr:hypothetical protein [Burkholderiales bacterium]